MSAAIETNCKNCGASNSELRQKRASNGARMIAYQCLTCGHAASSWLKQSTVRNPDSLPSWDDDATEHYYESRRAENPLTKTNARDELARLQANREWWTRYSAYLSTPAWRSRRAMVMQRAGGWCEGCRQTEASVVHHLTYQNVGNEFLWELVAVCEDCHKRCHPHLAEAPT